MDRKIHFASQPANTIKDWLGEESEDDGSNCSSIGSSDDEAESNIDEVSDSLNKDEAEADNSCSSSEKESNVLINSAVSLASPEYFGRSGRRWSESPPPLSRTRGANIFTVSNWEVQINPQSKVECFDSFFPPAMLNHILKDTNQNTAAHSARKKMQWDPIDMVELKAFFGILYLLGVSKENHENIRNLWSDGPMARPVFKATISVNRFESIRCHLRFDS